MGGRTDGQSSRLAGSRLPALCAPGRLPVPFVASACGKQQPRLAIRSPTWMAPHPPRSGPNTQKPALGRRQAGRGDLGNQPLCALQGRDLWLTASSGPRRSQDVVVVTVVLIRRGHPRLGDGHLGLLLLLHTAAQGQDAVVQGRVQLARVLGAGLGRSRKCRYRPRGAMTPWVVVWLLPCLDGMP